MWQVEPALIAALRPGRPARPLRRPESGGARAPPRVSVVRPVSGAPSGMPELAGHREMRGWGRERDGTGEPKGDLGPLIGVRAAHHNAVK